MRNTNIKYYYIIIIIKHLCKNEKQLPSLKVVNVIIRYGMTVLFGREFFFWGGGGGIIAKFLMYGKPVTAHMYSQIKPIYGMTGLLGRVGDLRFPTNSSR